MKNVTQLLLCVFVTILMLSGCGGKGYKKSGGKWTHVVVNAAVGREVRSIDADVPTFRVLGNPQYACDKNHVYHFGHILDGVDGGSYEAFEGSLYARDKNHVYFREHIVFDADPDSFRLLAFPYARDATNIYCGCLRMNVDNPDDFRVLSSEVGLGLPYYSSTDDLVKQLGPEFANYPVKYDEKFGTENNKERYRIAAPDSGSATDGVWIFQGPKRLQPAAAKGREQWIS